jgi:hypothetical protein
MERTLWENRKYTISKCINLYMRCKSCGQEFNNLVGGVEYSSTVIGVLAFCSDSCCKDYLNTLEKT